MMYVSKVTIPSKNLKHMHALMGTNNDYTSAN